MTFAPRMSPRRTNAIAVREQLQRHAEIAGGNQMAVIPEHIPEGSRMSVGTQLPAIVGTEQGPREGLPAFLAQLLEGQGTIEEAILEESRDPVAPPTDTGVGLRHALEHLMHELVEGERRGLFTMPGTPVDGQLADDGAAAPSDQPVHIEAGFSQPASNGRQLPRATDATHAFRFP